MSGGPAGRLTQLEKGVSNGMYSAEVKMRNVDER